MHCIVRCIVLVLRLSCIDINEIIVLGEGSYGMVVLCKKLSTGKKYAMKLQEKDSIIKFHEEDGSDVNAECRVLAECSHPYIIPLHYAFCTNNLTILVMSYAPDGDLSSHMRACEITSLPVDRLIFYLSELVSAVGYLHDRGVMHRDIKPGNMLLSSDGHIMLTDFGSVWSGAMSPLLLGSSSGSDKGRSKLHRHNRKNDVLRGLKANTIVGTDGYTR